MKRGRDNAFETKEGMAVYFTLSRMSERCSIDPLAPEVGHVTPHGMVRKMSPRGSPIELLFPLKGFA
jgi:hypothetical protein